MRPLILDILSLLGPIAIAVGLFFLGKHLRRLPAAVRVLLVALAVGVVAVGALTLARQVPPEVAWRVSDFGGSTVLLSWAAIFLLGVVWTVPGRSFSSSFIAAIALIAGCLVGIESMGRLWWRWNEPQSWDRFPNNAGMLQQTSGASCSPTAATMLLAQYGIKASEGEMAYRAGTSLFGTDAPSIAHALREKLAGTNWKVHLVKTDYEGARAIDEPFIAHVSGQRAGHAILVEGLLPHEVPYLDPADGQRKAMSRDDFIEIWDGTAIYLTDGDRH